MREADADAYDDYLRRTGVPGDEEEEARYYPEDEAFLLEPNSHVLQYHVLGVLEPLEAG